MHVLASVSERLASYCCWLVCGPWNVSRLKGSSTLSARLRVFPEALEKLVVDAHLHENTRGGAVVVDVCSL